MKALLDLPPEPTENDADADRDLYRLQNKIKYVSFTDHRSRGKEVPWGDLRSNAYYICGLQTSQNCPK